MRPTLLATALLSGATVHSFKPSLVGRNPLQVRHRHADRVVTAAATEEKEAEAAAAPKASSIPNLPGDALVMSSPGESTWLLEKKEFAAIESGGNEDTGPAPGSFAPVLQSFEMQGVYYHAFPNTGDALETADMPKLLLKDDGESPLPVPVADAVRLTLIRDLLDAVHWLHLQGLPHMGLTGTSVRLYKKSPEGGQRRAFWRLALVGLGAGPQVATRETVFQLNNESWPFNPPETTTGGLIQGNLPGFYAWDAWSVGAVMTMLIGGDNVSPFEAEANLFDGTFSTQAAVGKQIKKTFEDASGFLTALNTKSGGFLFRNGWLVEILLGLLKQDPDERMTITSAWEIMSSAAPVPGAKGGKSKELGRFASKKPEKSMDASSKKLGPAKVRKLRAAFNAFDTDRSGDIDSEEIVGAMTRVGVSITLEQAAALTASVDGNGDGLIDFDEFVIMMQDLPDAKLDSDTPLTANEIFGPRFGSTQGEPFRSLESMISIADKGLCEVLIQDRTDIDYGTALKNYGEIVGFRNRADGDRWDIVVPGLVDQLPTDSRHRLSAVLGVIMLKGGNHKLVVALGGSKPDPEKVSQDVKGFIEEYAKSHPEMNKSRMRYMQLDDPYSPAGSVTTDALSIEKAFSESE